MDQTEVFTGYIQSEGVRIEVNFSVPVGASQEQKDVAFVNALAQVADVNYLSIGTT